MTHIATDVVRDAARGQWLSILGYLAPELSTAIQKVGRHVPCPIHGGKDGFRFFKDAGERGDWVCATCGEGDGFELLMRLYGATFPDVKQWITGCLHLEPGTDRLPPPRKRERPVIHETSPEESENRKGKLVEVWKATKPDDGTIDAYLRSRSLFLPTTDQLRLHPNLPYFDQDGKLLGNFPTMIAKVQALDGEGVSLHRTYLQPDGAGKAPVPSPKKLMTPVRDGALMGAAIRLTEAGETLALAEGIETALAVREACKLEEFDLPVWATVTAGGMERVQLPSTVKRVEIWGDNDASGRGQEAAQILAQRLHDEGKEVYVFLPPTPGKDWLDVLNECGHPAIWEARQKAKRWTPKPPEPETTPEPTGAGGTKRTRRPPLTGRQLAQLPPPSFLVQDYVPAGGLTVLYGPSGAGKSFVVLDWALSVATGRPWFGKQAQQGGVIYVAAEGIAGLTPRVGAWERGRSFPDPLGLPNMHYDYQAVDLMDPKEVDEFIAVNTVLAPKLVVLDTLARNAVGAEENSAKDMGRVIEGADRIRAAFGAAVILVHHTGKNGTTERGSGAIRGAADSMVYLTLQDDIIIIGVDKAKDSEPPEPIAMRRVPVLHTNSCVMMLADATAPEKLTQAQRKALKDLKELGGAATLNRWLQMADMKLNQLMPVVNALVERGHVDAPEPGSKGGKYTITAAGYGAL